MTDFSAPLLAWHERHGRHDLPWQVCDPYLRWLAEIMLQQTTVATVVPYFERFRARFPSVAALAEAPLDDVLALWAGLGYYARARNLHASARLVMARHGGVFPRTLAAWTALPGVGPSTAGAILAFAFGISAPILDANARRVLGRFHGLRGRDATTTRQLWDYAQAHTPLKGAGVYTQAIMDLGALVCRRTPDCGACPVARSCAYDGSEPPPLKRVRPERTVVMAIVHDRAQKVLLVRRPPHGIWGGLWSLPECPTLAELPQRLASLGIGGHPAAPCPPRRHVFTHFALSIVPVPVALGSVTCRVSENSDMMWYKRHGARPGMPAPIWRLLNHFMEII
ncbi:MAG TPA: A/G-specific adenine glycosylase [Acidiferrobacter sp.]|nr:A/G-specific adenine glycosylase [Acidiferrobacter sp.]